MSVTPFVTGIQHIGIPTKDMKETVDFYQGLGFRLEYHQKNDAGEIQVAFLSMGSAMIETYYSAEAVGVDGAIDHMAFNVTDIEEVYLTLQSSENGAIRYQFLEEGIQQLPFWEYVVKYFVILGPNHEKIEFSQLLTSKQ